MFKTVNLALQLKENHHGILDLDIKTSTVTLVGMCIFFSCIHVYAKIDTEF